MGGTKFNAVKQHEMSLMPLAKLFRQDIALFSMSAACQQHVSARLVSNPFLHQPFRGRHHIFEYEVRSPQLAVGLLPVSCV